MTKKTRNAYDKVFGHLAEIMTGIAVGSSFMSDFEAAVYKSLELAFPTCSIVHCVFHYCDAIRRKAMKLGMQPFYANDEYTWAVIHLVMALAYLPSNKVEIGLELIECYWNAAAHDDRLAELMVLFMNYYRSYWLAEVTAIRFSVYELPHRTNNSLESWHSSLPATLGKHTLPVHFAVALSQVDHSATVCFAQEMRGLVTQECKSKYYLLNDLAIKTFMSRFNGGQLMKWSFKAIAYRVSSMREGFRLDCDGVIPNGLLATPNVVPRIPAVNVTGRYRTPEMPADPPTFNLDEAIANVYNASQPIISLELDEPITISLSRRPPRDPNVSRCPRGRPRLYPRIEPIEAIEPHEAVVDGDDEIAVTPDEWEAIREEQHLNHVSSLPPEVHALAIDLVSFLSGAADDLIVQEQPNMYISAILHTSVVTWHALCVKRAVEIDDDKDLVHEFVQNNGLASLIKVGCEADQNYQNYILRALGQVMLYVDGMNGVINHPETVQWFYSLIATKYRLVVKTAIKLLLVFVEYTETNCTLLVKTITNYDINRGVKPWFNIMQLLGEKDSSDMELLVFATTLINKTLYGIPDQDTYYDVVDALEEQGMERIIQKYMSKQGTDLDLLQQFHIYEAVLKHEDGEDNERLLQMEAQVRQIPRSRKSNENERRKSWRHGSVSTVSSPYRNKQTNCLSPDDSSPNHIQRENRKQWLEKPIRTQINGYNTDSSDLNGVTPALRRRRERQDRQQMFIKEQEETVQKRGSLTDTSGRPFLERQRSKNSGSSESQSSDPVLNSRLRNSNSKEPADSSNLSTPVYARQQSWVLSMLHTKSQDEEAKDEKCGNGYVKETPEKTSVPESSPHIDMAARINLLRNNLSGIVSKAKEGLISQCSRNDEEKSPTLLLPPVLNAVEPKKENDLQWEQLMSTLDRPLIITDLDFTDLGKEDDENIFQLSQVTNNFRGRGPPPPPTMNGAPLFLPFGIGAPPPPPPGCYAPPPPPLTRGIPPPPTLINESPSGILLANNNNIAAKTIKKNKKQ
uniref:GBD/FH3 domain-containing protein n=1 Tax=Strigamia maritima TaxID=126957 RepID=T1IVY7_STRMM